MKGLFFKTKCKRLLFKQEGIKKLWIKGYLKNVVNIVFGNFH